MLPNSLLVLFLVLLTLIFAFILLWTFPTGGAAGMD